ncbi:unnamed protein product [Ceutorhynchus assimilis]|uniref:GPI ethanolamine phosphate transferase 3 n=1 Tax=Ceutorhynchus assimilis TaxID=467358 RepID=A0A9N9QP56_9CUCU|nr:unnamed protein product [Ceutorhynchus assimilis]
MKRKLKYILTILWFAYLITASILLFKKGFLLTREVQDKNATCSLLAPLERNCPSAHDESVDCISNDRILMQSLFDNANSFCYKTNTKVILLVVDALRYDFTVYDEENSDPLPYENKLPVIRNVLKEFPESSHLYKFIADPPTTTMQRLKALTTGSLPTFIDAGSNFATSEINEDNIIDQVIKNAGKVIFMGDDTWANLFPKRFLRNYPYPSFDVWDLDTVDKGVMSTLIPELKNSDWNFLIGHFLGVDHCGHRYGPNHPEMTRKLSEINNAIEYVMTNMDDDMILFVIGDHGMTVTGDHGGESLDETTAAMFVHSKQSLLPFDRQKRAVKQVDLVPTLSALLGIPIPFQNLGILIKSALPMPNYKTGPNYNTWQLPLFWLWGNLEQVINYIREYSKMSSIFDEEYLKMHFETYESLREELPSIDSEEKFLKFSKKVEEFLIKIRTLCEEVWIQFDAFSISNGLTFLFLSIFFMFIISDGIPLKDLPLAIEGSFVIVCIIGLIFSVIAVAVLSFSDIIGDSLYSSILITNILSHLMFLLPLIQNWGVISFNWHTKNKTYGIINFMCRFVLIFSVAGVFSNSFINEESSVLLFLLVTVILLNILGIASFLKNESNTKKKNSDTISMGLFLKLAFGAVVILVLLRTSMYFWRCRIEQEWCFKGSNSEIGNNYKSESSKLQWCYSVVSLSLMLSLIRMWLKKCGNLNGNLIPEIFTKLIPNVILVCIAGFWVLQKLSGNTSSVSRMSNYLALSVYCLTFISLTVLLFKPLCVSIIFTGNDEHSNVISNIFNKIKGTLNKKNNDNGAPIVCGLGTAYSAVYILISIYFTFLFALVLGNVFAFSVVIMIVVGSFFLLATSILRIKMAETPDDLLNVPTIAILGWILLSQYFFFATGHQPSFPNVAWESASIGTSGLITNTYVLGALIILNTFGSYMLAGMLLPLLVIAPFTLLILMPSLVGRQKEFAGGPQKGEMILFEKERLTMSTLFSVSCKYIAGHSIKVFAIMLAATIHCRHLMVWNVFAPKFIFEAIGLFVTSASVLLGFLIFLRVHSQVEQFVNKLNKMN